MRRAHFTRDLNSSIAGALLLNACSHGNVELALAEKQHHNTIAVKKDRFDGIPADLVSEPVPVGRKKLGSRIFLDDQLAYYTCNGH